MAKKNTTGSYTKDGKKRREKAMKDAGTWAKDNKYHKPPSGRHM